MFEIFQNHPHGAFKNHQWLYDIMIVWHKHASLDTQRNDSLQLGRGPPSWELRFESWGYRASRWQWRRVEGVASCHLRSTEFFTSRTSRIKSLRKRCMIYSGSSERFVKSELEQQLKQGERWIQTTLFLAFSSGLYCWNFPIFLHMWDLSIS